MGPAGSIQPVVVALYFKIPGGRLPGTHGSIRDGWSGRASPLDERLALDSASKKKRSVIRNDEVH